jgi:glycosyl transferase family 25
MNFDKEIYLALNPELLKLPKELLYRHYIMGGKKEGRKYNIKQVYPDFTVENYKKQNPDLDFKEDIEYERHYLLKGLTEKRLYKSIDTLLEYEKTKFPEEREDLFEWIDMILYINLDKREDRRLHFLDECNRIGVPAKKLLRIPGILDEKRGVLGCSKSHIQALSYAIDNNLNNVLIFEDDVNFIDSKKNVYNTLYLLGTNTEEFDVIQLTACNIKPVEPYSHLFNKCVFCTMASGYIVNKRFMKTLRQNMIDGLKLLEKTDDGKYTLDRYWSLLQPKSKWYTLVHRIIYQRKSYSDNQNCITDYKC